MFKLLSLIKEFDNTAQGINFFGKMYNKDISVSAPVIGTHNAKNIVPCYLVADFLGISIEEAKSQTNKLVLPDNTLSIINYGEAIILDDTYNSNYNGFCAGLDVLSGYSNKKRIVVTRGIPELGAMSTEVHTKIGSEIAYIADELIILDKDNAEASEFLLIKFLEFACVVGLYIFGLFLAVMLNKVSVFEKPKVSLKNIVIL